MHALISNESLHQESLRQQGCAAVSGERLNRWIQTLAAIGGRPDGGVSRETLTEGDWQARRWLIDLAHRLGCTVHQDHCANLFFTRRGKTDQPVVMTGSHIDTQPIGGKLDGAYGVLAGLEVIAALNDAAIDTEKPLAVAVWTNEEGARFAPGAMGSSSFSNPQRLARYLNSTDDQGTTFADALQHTLAAFNEVPPRPATPVSAYLELHIEQGPVLEAQGASLGIVTNIQGVRWYRVHCLGTMAHAGTTPMEKREDAMARALTLAHQLQQLSQAATATGLRFTIGRWQVSPNAVNTIPGRVEFTCDLRAENDHYLAQFCRQLEQTCDRHGARYECFFARNSTHFPAPMMDIVTRATQAAAHALDLTPAIRLPSGAFHDAMYLAECCDAAMLFVPSHGGISHNAAEYTTPEDLYRGAWALTHALLQLTGAREP